MEPISDSNESDVLNLELSLGQVAQIPPSVTMQIPNQARNQVSNGRRSRSKANTTPIDAPYPWSTRQRAVVHKLDYLQSNNIVAIAGELKCCHCGGTYVMKYDVVTKLDEIVKFINRNMNNLHDRAPSSWMSPILPNCMLCKKENCMEPVLPSSEDEQDSSKDAKDIEDENSSKINWLFLLLGQLLGCLSLKQLIYFCTHTNNHRTGAKDRLLFYTYFTLCRQLQPSNPLFHL